MSTRCPTRRSMQFCRRGAGTFISWSACANSSLNTMFLCEHPCGAARRQDSWVQGLLKDNRVVASISDQWEFGLTPTDNLGNIVRALKPTEWAISSMQMVSRLGKRFSKIHRHQALMGRRAASADLGQTALISKFLRGIRDTVDRVHHSQRDGSRQLMRATVSRGKRHDLKQAPAPEAVQQRRLKRVRVHDGTSRTISLSEHYNDLCRGGYTGGSFRIITKTKPSAKSLRISMAMWGPWYPCNMPRLICTRI